MSTHQLISVQEQDLINYSKRFSGKLLLRQEIELDDETFQLFLAHNLFKAIPSIEQRLFTYKCQRCGNEKRSLFNELPCGLCQKNHVYCRKCIVMGRVLACQPLFYWIGPEVDWPKYTSPSTWQGELTVAQQKAADRIVRAILHKEKEILVWAVCGAGKTEMLFPGISEMLQQGKRVCIATPRADVVRELLPRLKIAFSSILIQGLYGGSNDKDGVAQLIIATTHQLLRFKKAFDCLIIDEIDAFPFHKDPSLPYAANRAKKQISTTVYLTATPRQAQRKQISRKKLPHIFVPNRFHGNPLPVPKTKMCLTLKKDLSMYHFPKPFKTWLSKRQNPQRQLLIFVPTINLAIKLRPQLMLQMKILDQTLTAYVHSEDSEREEKVKLFREKKIETLITTTILERGVTFPSVDVAILDAGHDVFDEAALVQIAGRAGRSPKDPTGEVVFFHEGKTKAMEKAIHAIKMMNKRGGFK